MIKMEWLADWAWGLPLTALTIAFHVAAVGGIAAILSRMQSGSLFAARRLRFGVLRTVAVIGAVGWMLAALHGIEAVIWAGAYTALHALPTFSDAILYSIDSMTTRGESGLRLERDWRLLGALEASNGVLLFGISTAFLFAVAVELRTSLRERSEPFSHRPPPSHDIDR
jgi:hypothetical protein